MSLTKVTYAMIEGSPANILDFGGVCDGVTNDANALIAALGTGLPVVIPANSYILLSAGQVVTFIENLNLVTPLVKVTFNLPAGDFAITTQVEINNPYACNITIIGSVATMVSTTAFVGTTGGAKNYAATYTLSSVSQVAINDYLYIGYTVGTGDYKVAEGCWKVTNVAGSNVTVKHTLNATFPALTLTSSRCIPLKTILRWPTTQRGIAISGTSLRGLQNLVIASQFDISTGAASDTYSDGIQVGTAADFLTTGSSESQQTNDGALWCTNVGIVEWSGNGVQVGGGGFYMFQGAACSNGWRGFQAARCGTASAKFTSAIGNGASGYQAEAQGFMDASGAVAAGNWQQGVYSISPSGVLFSSGFAYGNGGAGLDARNYGNINADGATTKNNTTYGINCTAGFVLFGVSATASGNTIKDVLASEGGVVNGTGASSLGNITSQTLSGSLVILPSGIQFYPSETRLQNVTSNAATKYTETSIADTVVSTDAAGAGSFTDVLRFKANGSINPEVNVTSGLGTTASRWLNAYIRDIFPGVGTAIWTSGAGSPEGAVTAVVGSLYTRTDGGAVTTLYVKETGSGNTGWVAK